MILAANDDAPLGFVVETIKTPDGAWVVEGIHHGGEGQIYRAVMSGPAAEHFAGLYAAILRSAFDGR
jgi:hypothetical protein